MLPSELPDWVRRPAVDTEDGTIDKPDGALFPDDGARVADVSVAWHEPDGSVASHAWRFWDAEGRGEDLPRSEWDALLDWLLARDGLVMMNAPYDTIMLGVGTGNGYPGVDLVDRVCWDIGLVSAFLDPGERVALGEQAKRHLGVSAKEDTKEPILKWLRRRRRQTSDVRYQLWAYYLAPWDLVRPYAASDAELTIRLARKQWGRLLDGEGGPNRWRTVAEDLEIMRTLVRMERRGLPYDPVRSLQIADELAVLRDELERELPFGHPTPNKLKAWFFDRHKVTPLKWSDKTGEPSCDSETIEYMAESGVPGAAELGRYKQVDLAELRWYRAFAEMTAPDGRLRPRFRQTSVRSGRLSIERVQLQAIPHNHVLARSPDLSKYPTPRQLIRPEPGWEIWEMDLAQAELRVAAWMAQAENMLAIIREGRDPHGELASKTFPVKPGDEDWFKYRQVGKRGNFSLIFGIGIDRLRRDVKTQTGIQLPVSEARAMIDTFHGMHPEFKQKIREVSRAAGRNLRVELVNGRTNHFQLYELDKDYDDPTKIQIPRGIHKAFNRKVQASIGEFAKAWMVEVEAMLRQEIDDPRHGLLLQIHDALVISVPEGETGEVLAKEAVEIGRRLWVKWFTRDVISRRTGKPIRDYTVPGDIEYGRWGGKG